MNPYIEKYLRSLKESKDPYVQEHTAKYGLDSPKKVVQAAREALEKPQRIMAFLWSSLDETFEVNDERVFAAYHSTKVDKYEKEFEVVRGCLRKFITPSEDKKLEDYL